MRAETLPYSSLLLRSFASILAVIFGVALQLPLWDQMIETLMHMSVISNVKCETFNLVTSGNYYPDVRNHFGQQLPDCRPGDESGPSSLHMWKMFGRKENGEMSTYCVAFFLKSKVGPVSHTSKK